ncbi:MAG: PaaI family thioesterase [Tannerellaceae bacterium]|jgi:acyl-coenzyme A thioesterase PaaI-like protein|nr:PaaI family thioesterase [Tannerellaceae bacterium]
MKKIINPWVGMEGYLCFACSPDNPSGLQMEFYEEGDEVVSLWKPTNYQQGWLKTLHGGIQCTLMDELAAWVILKKLQTTGVTSKMEIKFIKSISTEEPLLTVRGRIKDKKRNAVFVDTGIYNAAGELCSRAEIVYFIVSPERARESFCFDGCRTEE